MLSFQIKPSRQAKPTRLQHLMVIKQLSKQQKTQPLILQAGMYQKIPFRSFQMGTIQPFLETEPLQMIRTDKLI